MARLLGTRVAAHIRVRTYWCPDLDFGSGPTHPKSTLKRLSHHWNRMEWSGWNGLIRLTYHLTDMTAFTESGNTRFQSRPEEISGKRCRFINSKMARERMPHGQAAIPEDDNQRVRLFDRQLKHRQHHVPPTTH